MDVLRMDRAVQVVIGESCSSSMVMFSTRNIADGVKVIQHYTDKSINMLGVYQGVTLRTQSYSAYYFSLVILPMFPCNIPITLALKFMYGPRINNPRISTL